MTLTMSRRDMSANHIITAVPDSISGLVVEYVVAIDIRFPADADFAETATHTQIHKIGFQA